MILINSNWEMVNDIDDVLRICAENISDEFAKEVKKIFDMAIDNEVNSIEQSYIRYHK